MSLPFRVRFPLHILAVSLPLGLVGCVPYVQYEQVKNERDRLSATNEDLKAKYNTAIQKILRLEKDGASNEGYLAKIANLESVNKDLLARLQQTSQVTPFSEADIAKIRKVGGEVEEKGIMLGENILFNAGENKLKPKAAEVLDTMVEILQKDHSNEIVHITGHTDSDPLNKTRRLWEYNINLGYQRAYTVYKYFIDKGIPEKRMVLHTLGWLKPIAENNSTEGKARNRRVVIELGATQI